MTVLGGLQFYEYISGAELTDSFNTDDGIRRAAMLLFQDTNNSFE